MAVTDRQKADDPHIGALKGAHCDVPPSSHQDLIRGACPSLAAPMATGDGLLVRLRPSTPGLTIGQLRNLARAASRHGNGLLEITARGNIQIRGLSAATMAALAADIDKAGIVPESGLTIETPPLSGRDPTEIADARAMAAHLRQTVPPALQLAPKLTVIVDGGGRFHLDALPADIRLVAVEANLWELSVGGARAQSRVAFLGPADQTLTAATGLLKFLDALGPRARGRDLAATLPPSSPLENFSPPSFLGIQDIGSETAILGLTPRYGQMQADQLLALLDITEAAGCKEVRMAPDHALLFLDLSPGTIGDVREAAIELGFDADETSPFRRIASCSGAGACASATYRTKQLAAEIVAWIPTILDGLVNLHLSGCPKGCAHPAAVPLAIVGLGEHYGIVLGGKASDTPVLLVDKIHLKSALQRLAALVGDSIAAGESVKACLERLGGATIAAALRQE